LKTILTVLREQDKTGDTIAEALGGGATIAEALSKDSSDESSDKDDSEQ
jgi:hypothetical protein